LIRVGIEPVDWISDGGGIPTTRVFKLVLVNELVIREFKVDCKCGISVVKRDLRERFWGRSGG
jgi:hypothetical protein